MQRRRTRKKFKDERYHFAQALLRKYGISNGIRLQEEVRRQIRNRKSLFLFRTSNNFTCHLVVLEGQEIPVIWDRMRSQAVTALEIGPSLRRRIENRRKYVESTKTDTDV